MDKLLNVVLYLFCTSWNKTKMQIIYVNSKNLIKIEQLAYLKFYSNVSTLKLWMVKDSAVTNRKSDGAQQI